MSSSTSNAFDMTIGTRIVEVPVQRVNGVESCAESDLVAVEEPLEIRLVHDEAGERVHTRIVVTMRTPGHDVDLALGFLFSEGIIRGYADVDMLRHSGPDGGKPGNRNILTVTLKRGVAFDKLRLERHFFTSSSCGICGKTSLEALALASSPSFHPQLPYLTPLVIHALPEKVRQAQAVFDHTGGLHAAALFDTGGALLSLREDIGRHNAVDKLIGAQVLDEHMSLSDRILFVSGRASFELTQKALMAGIPVLAAVSAPSSLAVALAAEYGMTLLGFVRDSRFNVYTGLERIHYTHQ